MKKLILILGIAMVALTSCKKDDIKPSQIHSPIENTIEDTIVTPHTPSISDSMTFVRIIVYSKSVSMGININNDGIDYPVYGNSVDSSIYVSKPTHYSNYSLSWYGWIKPDSHVTVSGSYNGMGNTNVFSFEIRVLIDGNNNSDISNWINITTSNKDYSTIFYVK